MHGNRDSVDKLEGYKCSLLSKNTYTLPLFPTYTSISLNISRSAFNIPPVIILVTNLLVNMPFSKRLPTGVLFSAKNTLFTVN